MSGKMPKKLRQYLTVSCFAGKRQGHFRSRYFFGEFYKVCKRGFFKRIFWMIRGGDGLIAFLG